MIKRLRKELRTVFLFKNDTVQFTDSIYFHGLPDIKIFITPFMKYSPAYRKQRFLDWLAELLKDSDC